MGEAARSLMMVLRRDPTRTATDRRAWTNDMSVRFTELMRDIHIAVAEMDVLGIGDTPPGTPRVITFTGKDIACTSKVAEKGAVVPHSTGLQLLAPPDPARFTAIGDSAKAREFMLWLEEQEAAGILEIIRGPAGPEPWTNTYVRSSYSKGLAQGRANLRSQGLSTLPSFNSNPGALSVVMNQPVNAQRLALMYQRVFTDLEGITANMNTQIARVLTRGLAAGIGPDEMARQINDVIQHTTGAPLPPNHPKGMRGIERARLLARTETVEVFNLGALAEYEAAEAIIGRRILVEWETAGDERVRLTHEDRSGRIYDFQTASTLIGEPNCRCTLLPVIEGVSDNYPGGGA